MRRAEAEHLSDGDIAVADDHDLDPGRRAAIDAHLRGCSHCRQRLAESRHIGALLRRRYPVAHDPGAWEAFAGRLAERERRRAGGPRALLAAAPLLALLVLLVAGVQVWRASLGAGEPTPLRHVAESRPGVGALPFAAVEPGRLPLGLARAERSTPAADRLELLYRNGDGLAVLLAESPATGPPPAVPPSEAGQTRRTIGGAEVLVLNDPRPRAAVGALWDRRGVRFELLVTEAPPGGLAVEDIERVVAALADAQDAAPR